MAVAVVAGEVAVVERFKQELMYGLSVGTKTSGRCREVAISRGSTVKKSRSFLFR